MNINKISFLVTFLAVLGAGCSNDLHLVKARIIDKPIPVYYVGSLKSTEARCALTLPGKYLEVRDVIVESMRAQGLNVSLQKNTAATLAELNLSGEKSDTIALISMKQGCWTQQKDKDFGGTSGTGYKLYYILSFIDTASRAEIGDAHWWVSSNSRVLEGEFDPASSTAKFAQLMQSSREIQESKDKARKGTADFIAEIKAAQAPEK